MKVLFAVDSVFQLMIAVNLRLTEYKNDDADIVIYNSTLNADVYAKRLKDTRCFSNVYLAETPLTYCGGNYSFKKKLPKYFVYLKSLLVPNKTIEGICNGFGGNYDIFLFNGVGALPECIFNAITRKNATVNCYRFEDSYLSYTQEYGSNKGSVRKILERFSSIFGRKRLEQSIRGYYFSEPYLVNYEFKYPVLVAPKFSRNNDRLIETLNYVFSMKELVDDYKERYIFFECGDAFFFNNNDDLRYINKLIEIVGKENILIKRHPRIKDNRFEDLGVHIASGASVPWELIQLNMPLSDKVFITTKSAAAISSEIYFGDKCSAMFLYKGIEGEQGEIGTNFKKYMEKFKQKSQNGFWLPENIEEFTKLINMLEVKK